MKKIGLTMATVYPKHDEDVYGWAIHTANLLRNKKMDDVDFDNIIEEIEVLGRSEQHELKNRLSLVISHLLKWHYQSGKRTRSWELTIEEQRLQAAACLEVSPSLKSHLDEILRKAYDIGKIKAQKETELDKSVFPQECPYSFEEIMSDAFYPE